MNTTTKLFLLLLVSTFVSFSQTFAKEYHFLATEDNLYINPANWYPAYPGTEIAAGDLVKIEADMLFQGFQVNLQGEMEVSLGAEITSSDGEFIIHPTGILTNAGAIRIRGIRNFGQFTNKLSAETHLSFFSAHRHALTSNMTSADFITTGDAVNVGTFNNYGHCAIGNDLINMEQSVFNQMQHATLVVRGTVQTSAEARVNESPESSIQQPRATRVHTTPDTQILGDAQSLHGGR